MPPSARCPSCHDELDLSLPLLEILRTLEAFVACECGAILCGTFAMTCFSMSLGGDRYDTETRTAFVPTPADIRHVESVAAQLS